MDLAGEEKRIQALFSEASLHDHSTAPSFKRVWASAEIRATRTAVQSRSRFVFAIASLVLIVAASAVGGWFYRSTSTATDYDAKITSQPDVTPLLQPAPQLAQQSKHVNTANRLPRQKRFRRAPQVQRAAIKEAALLSRWQSPTQLLMQFFKTVDLSSLPQLNQSAEALKQFLPANTDLKKESNQ